MVAMGKNGMAINLKSKKWYKTTTMELKIAVIMMFRFPKNQMYSKGIFLPINMAFRMVYLVKKLDPAKIHASANTPSAFQFSNPKKLC